MKTAVTALGGVLSAVGAGMMISAAVMETFVVVTLPGEDACDTDFLGQIGIYKSSYDPECTVGGPYELVYTSLDAIESQDTTSFPLLFPSQSGFGGALGDVDDFESCDVFWGRAGPGETAIVNTVTDLVYRLTEEGVQEGFAPTKALLEGVAIGLGPGLSSYVNGLYAGEGGAVDSVLTSFIDAGGAVALVASSLCDPTTDFTDFCSGGSGQTVHDRLIAIGDCSNAADAAVCSIDGVPAAVGLYAANFFVAGAPSLYEGLFGIKYAEGYATQDWTTLKASLPLITAGVDLADKPGLQAAMLTLSLCDNTVLTGCDAIYTAPTAPSDPNTNDKLCYLVALDSLKESANQTFPVGNTLAGSPGAALVAELGDNDLPDFDCTFLDAVTLMSQNDLLAVFQELFGDEVTAEAVGLVFSVTIAGCPTPLTFTECFTNVAEYNNEIPDDLTGTALTWLPAAAYVDAGIPGREFANPQAFFTALAASPDDLEALSGGLIVACLAGVYTTPLSLPTPSTLTGCIAAIKAGSIVSESSTATLIGAGLLNGLGPLVPGEENTAASRIEGCSDDVKDIEVFELCQMLVPAAAAVAGIGAIVSLVAVAKKAVPFAVVGGVLAAGGGVILLAALLYLREEAPVYQLVGGDEVTGEPYYGPGSAQFVSLAAIAMALLGGVMTIGSICCDKDGESSALTSKVDNTY